ncbi:MAG: PqqD family protein [Rikenellaceae bacterium]
MRVIEGFKLRQVADEWIVSGEGVKQTNYNKLISLNSSAAFLWQKVMGGEEFDAELLAELLTWEFAVDYDTAIADAEDIIAQWLDVKIIEE